MTELVARMEPEAPPDYVTFVGRHIATLRTESDRLTGDIGHGEEIYAEALSDVAARWRWFELLRTRLGRPAVADHYLRRTLDARAKRWRDEQPYPVEVRAIRPVSDPAPPRRRQFHSSLGLRQAAFLAPEHHAARAGRRGGDRLVARVRGAPAAAARADRRRGVAALHRDGEPDRGRLTLRPASNRPGSTVGGMGGDTDIAAVGALVADRGRCQILLALLDGRALPASRLAAEAGVSPATASSHLGKLTDAGFLAVEARGRHRYYRLAGPEIARLIEALQQLAPAAPVTSLRQGTRAKALRDARTCYDHLAGRLGVALMAALIDRGHLVGGDGGYDPTRSPTDTRVGWGNDVDYALSAAGDALPRRLRCQCAAAPPARALLRRLERAAPPPRRRARPRACSTGSPSWAGSAARRPAGPCTSRRRAATGCGRRSATTSAPPAPGPHRTFSCRGGTTPAPVRRAPPPVPPPAPASPARPARPP